MSGLIAAIASGTAAVAGSISSFSQASKQKKRMQAAEREAKKAMAEAKTRLGVNVMEGTVPSRRSRMSLLGKRRWWLALRLCKLVSRVTSAGQQLRRGRVFMGQLAGQERVRTAMGQELQDIELAKIKEEARLADLGMGLSLEEAAGAQDAAANAEALRAQAVQQGFEGLIQAGATVAQAAPLYGGGGGDALNPRSMGANKDMLTRRQRAPYLEAMEAYDASQRSLGQSVFDTDFSSVGGVDTIGSRIGTGGQLSPQQLEALRLRIIQDPSITGGFVQ